MIACRHLITELERCRTDHNHLGIVGNSSLLTSVSFDGNRWHFRNRDGLRTVGAIVLLTLAPNAPDNSLTETCLAADLEDERGYWVVDAALPIPEGAEVVWRW
ncbi:MAG: hypothetical protein ACT4QC_15190 [Planctomycetaceae bacterium]